MNVPIGAPLTPSTTFDMCKFYEPTRAVTPPPSKPSPHSATPVVLYQRWAPVTFKVTAWWFWWVNRVLHSGVGEYGGQQTHQQFAFERHGDE